MRHGKYSENSILNYLSLRQQESVLNLAKYAGVSSSTMTGILNRLTGKRLVLKGDSLPTPRGRPTIIYKIQLPQPVFVCKVCGSSVFAGVLDTSLIFRAFETVPVERIETLEHAEKLIGDLIVRLEETSGLSRQDTAGLGLVINAAISGDHFLKSSVLPWAHQITFKAFSEKNPFNMPIRFINNLPVVAEYQRFIQEPPASLARFNVGDGIGAQIIIGDRLYPGNSLSASEVGHLITDPNGSLCGCGRRGCLEAYCSGPAIYRRILDEIATGADSVPDRHEWMALSPTAAMDKIWRLWQAQNKYILSFMDTVFDRLAFGLGTFLNIMDPECVVFSGYILEDHAPWMQEVVHRAGKWALPYIIEKTRFVQTSVTREDELRAIGILYFYQHVTNGTAFGAKPPKKHPAKTGQEWN